MFTCLNEGLDLKVSAFIPILFNCQSQRFLTLFLVEISILVCDAAYFHQIRRFFRIWWFFSCSMFPQSDSRSSESMKCETGLISCSSHHPQNVPRTVELYFSSSMSCILPL